MKNIIYYLLFSIIAFSCTPKEITQALPIEYVDSRKMLIGKTIETVNATALSSGRTKYLLAFNDGSTEKVSFGLYCLIEIGDSVIFKKEKTKPDYYYYIDTIIKQ